MIASPPRSLGLSLIESQRLYTPGSIARRISNLGRSLDQPDTLVNMGQMTPQDPKASTFSTRIDGLCHVDLWEGASQCTYVRSNTTLYRHQGWTRSYAAVKTGLTYDPVQPYPDVMVELQGQVVWSNGIDRPLLLDARQTSGRLAIPLGFEERPSRPSCKGPTQGGGYIVSGGTPMPLPPNYRGYTVHGKVGSVSEFNGQDGNLLDGSWTYAVQLEDVFGNLSPLSLPSQPVVLTQASCGYLNPQNGNYTRVNALDSLTRQFFVTTGDTSDEHVTALRLYRTQDTKHAGDATYYLLARIPGRQKIAYPDNIPDGQLVSGSVAQAVAPVPTFRVGCAYQGRLIAANTPNDPARLWWSEPGFPGTFLETSWVAPDPQGTITGATEHQGRLLCWTAQAMYEVQLTPSGPVVQPLGRAGCLAPHTIRTLQDGSLVWLGPAGVYRMVGGATTLISGLISDTLSRLSLGRVGRSVGCVDPVTGLYLLAFPTQERGWNDQFFLFDPMTQGWTEQNQGIFPGVFSATSAKTGEVFVAGRLSGANENVWVWNTPSPRASSSPSATYESVQLGIDPMGQVSFTLREMYVGFIETDTNPTPQAVFTWKTTAHPLPASKTTDFLLIGQDYDGTYVLPTRLLDDAATKYIRGTVRWRKVQLGSLRDITSFQFSVTFPTAQRVQLVGFKFIVDVADHQGSRTPGPTRSS